LLLRLSDLVERLRLGLSLSCLRLQSVEDVEVNARVDGLQSCGFCHSSSDAGSPTQPILLRLSW
jgi:hypothetical protein